MAFLHVFFFPVLISFALYSENSSVVQLTEENFSTEVLNSEDFWIVEFYAPWCGHCKKLAPEFEKAAASLKGVAKLGAVDMTVHGKVGGPYEIQGYPTLKVFGADKKNPTEYGGGRTAKSIISYVNKQIGREVGEVEEEQEEVKDLYSKDSKVVKLTEDNFTSLVLNSGDLWIVEFYAPWCGHCKSLAPEFEKAAAALDGVAKLGAVDMTVNGVVGQPYDVKGYPTLKVFGSNKSSPEEYSGGRNAKAIIKFVNKQLGIGPETTGPEIEDGVYVLTDDNFEELVLKSNDMWLIEFYAP